MKSKLIQEKEERLNNLLREVGTINVTVELPVKSWFYIHQKLIAGIRESGSKPQEVIDLIHSLGDMLVVKGVRLQSELNEMYKEAKIERKR